jgi:hypothetical protein
MGGNKRIAGPQALLPPLSWHNGGLVAFAEETILNTTADPGTRTVLAAPSMGALTGQRTMPVKITGGIQE